ncbi:hypothetical protein [Aquibacillus saliphilus]|nr:hypothetical protein [Aquibacillus saliphilus]
MIKRSHPVSIQRILPGENATEDDMKKDEQTTVDRLTNDEYDPSEN